MTLEYPALARVGYYAGLEQTIDDSLTGRNSPKLLILNVPTFLSPNKAWSHPSHSHCKLAIPTPFASLRTSKYRTVKTGGSYRVGK